MVAHCLYRTVFVVGAVLARLVHLRQVHPLRGVFLALASGKAERRQVHPLRLLLDVPAYC